MASCKHTRRWCCKSPTRRVQTEESLRERKNTALNRPVLIIVKLLDTDRLGCVALRQGVAWDPLGEMVVTQGADRTCRVYGPRPTAIGKKAAAAAAQPAVARVSDLSCQAVMSKIKVASAGGAEGGDKQSFDHLFRDENSGFYKRLSWSPDGRGGRAQSSYQPAMAAAHDVHMSSICDLLPRNYQSQCCHGIYSHYLHMICSTLCF